MGVALSGGRHACSPQKAFFVDFFTGVWRVFDTLSSMTLSRPHDSATPLSFRLQIAEIKSYLEPEGQGRGIIMRVWRCHRRQGVKNPPRTCKKSTKNAFRGEEAWRPPDNATPTFRMSNESWNQGLSADVLFVSLLAKVLSQYWKRLEKIYFYNFPHFEKLQK